MYMEQHGWLSLTRNVEGPFYCHFSTSARLKMAIKWTFNIASETNHFTDTRAVTISVVESLFSSLQYE